MLGHKIAVGKCTQKPLILKSGKCCETHVVDADLCLCRRLHEGARVELARQVQALEFTGGDILEIQRQFFQIMKIMFNFKNTWSFPTTLSSSRSHLLPTSTIGTSCVS